MKESDDIMWGAIIGDLAGSIYEFEQLKNVHLINPINDLIAKDSFYSDDTILTIAILDSILNNGNYEEYLKKYAFEYIGYKPNFTPYFKYPFSPNFIKWLNNDGYGYSNGNGAMMRISPVGYLFDTEREVIENAKMATIASHNTDEAITCATLIARIIYLARVGYPKDEIISYLDLQFKYIPFKQFNSTCYETIGNVLWATFTSSSFIESIQKIISIGGDTDTNACIVGSMAEALYGIDSILIEEAKTKIPLTAVRKLELGYQKNFKIL